ncbi:Zinc-binding domain of primase-helicase [Thiorhodovibrio winogradskyi]|uniref:Zinc-binding domain of primase-helicase n=1 Tax=Thiorhodovibrio winogradskyi TaxID=77007 RepID=A0ABZ0SBN7_9GAMM|nr:toprim domain-containing protein [Thiorhodovibrio winogradskyi]
MNPIESADVRQAVHRVGWLTVLDLLARPALEAALQRPGRHGPCPVHGAGQGDGFRLFPDVDRSGGGICATCGAYPDGFALLGWLFGWSFPEALNRVAGVLELTNATPPLARPAVVDRSKFPVCVSKQAADQARARLRALWNESLRPDHPGAVVLQRYLVQRGLSDADFDQRVLRFHPGLPYWSTAGTDRPLCMGRFPAMLALVSAPDGSAMTLHRTYLREDGAGKAPMPAPKKLMASGQNRSLVGSAVRLCPVERAKTPALGLAEGIETALAVRAMTGMPVWAALSATLLERFTPPPGLRRLVVWADKDRSGVGEQAAQALQRRLRASVEVRIRVPLAPIPPLARGVDWADVWQELPESRLAA